MGSVSKSAFLKPLRLREEQYPLPEYGEESYVLVRAMTSRDLVALQGSYSSTPDTSNLTFAFDVLARSLFDGAGNRLFESAADAQSNMELSLPALESLVERCLHVSGIKTEKN